MVKKSVINESQEVNTSKIKHIALVAESWWCTSLQTLFNDKMVLFNDKINGHSGFNP